MLQGLRAKVTGALNAALGDGGGGAGGGAHPQHHLPSPSSTSDPRLMRAERLVAAATSDQLPPDTPDWGATLELVDMINADPPGATPLVLVPLHRVLAMPTTPNATADTATPSTPHRQLLALAALEALVKNCRPQLHTALVNSPLWRPTAAEGGTGVLAAASSALPQAASSTAARSLFPTAEVRDRALALVEDLARGLPHEPRFMRDYEQLVDSGVDFPVRAVGEGQGEGSSAAAPFYVAPPEPTVGGVAGAGGANGTNDDLTDADRAAIAAAQADLEREAAARDAAALGGAASEAQHHPGQAAALALGPAAAWGAPIRPPGYVPPAGAVAAAQQARAQQRANGPGAPAAGTPTPTTTTTTAAPQPVPTTEAELHKTTHVAANSAELLREMVSPLAAQVAGGDAVGAAAGAREPFLADLADQCYRYRSLLQEAVMRGSSGVGAGGGGGEATPTTTTTTTTFSEASTAAALAANDDLQRALLAYEAVAAGRVAEVAAAAAVTTSGGGGGGDEGARMTADGAGAAAAATAAATTTTTPAFTLGDAEEDDDNAANGGGGLESTRAALAELDVGSGGGGAEGTAAGASGAGAAR